MVIPVSKRVRDIETFMIRWAMRHRLPLVFDLTESSISGCEGEQTGDSPSGVSRGDYIGLTSHSAKCCKTHRIVVQSSDDLLQPTAELTG